MSISTLSNPFVSTPTQANRPEAVDAVGLGSDDTPDGPRASAFASVLASIVDRAPTRSTVDPKLTSPGDRRGPSITSHKRGAADPFDNPSAGLRPQPNRSATPSASDDDSHEDDRDDVLTSATAERSAFLRSPSPMRHAPIDRRADNAPESEGSSTSEPIVATGCATGPGLPSDPATTGASPAGPSGDPLTAAAAPAADPTAATSPIDGSTAAIAPLVNATPAEASASADGSSTPASDPTIVRTPTTSTSSDPSSASGPANDAVETTTTGSPASSAAATPGNSAGNRSASGLAHAQSGLHGEHRGITKHEAAGSVVGTTPAGGPSVIPAEAGSEPVLAGSTEPTSSDVTTPAPVAASAASDTTPATSTVPAADAPAPAPADAMPVGAVASGAAASSPNPSSPNAAPTNESNPATSAAAAIGTTAATPTAPTAKGTKTHAVHADDDGSGTDDSAATTPVADGGTGDGSTTPATPPPAAVTGADHASENGEAHRSDRATAALASAPGQHKGESSGHDHPGGNSRADVAPVAAGGSPAAPVAPTTPRPVTASPAALATAAAASTSPTDVADQLVTTIRRFEGLDGTHHVTMELNPHGLGTVAIDMTLDGTTVHLRMTAEHAATGDLLRSSIDELRSSLQKGGFTAGQFDVGQQRSGQQPQQRQAATWSDEPWRGDRPTPSRLATTPAQAAERVRTTGTRADRRVDLAL